MIKKSFRCSSTEIRKKPIKRNEGTTLHIKYKKPFCFQTMLSFMRFRAIAGVEIVTETSYEQIFRTATGSFGSFSVRDNQKLSSLELAIK